MKQAFAYYNENDPAAAQWLRNLIEAKLIPHGYVDDRDIRNVRGSDVREFTAVHFFAGIGGWAEALRLAEWPADRSVWTGSCPCQPFSAAGKRQGTADARHLWPEFRRLIAECRPSIVFGEQVASRDGREWLAGVRADLEALAYGVGAADLCAASVGAPHIRQRLWWVGVAQPLGDTDESGLERRGVSECGRSGEWAARAPGCSDFGVSDANSERFTQRAERDGDAQAEQQAPCGHNSCGHSFWSDAEWFEGPDGKWRRAEPGVSLLAHGVPARVAKLRGIGNAIVPQVAAEIIKPFV